MRGGRIEHATPRAERLRIQVSPFTLPLASDGAPQMQVPVSV
jgi:hypothetical protein